MCAATYIHIVVHTTHHEGRTAGRIRREFGVGSEAVPLAGEYQISVATVHGVDYIHDEAPTSPDCG